VSSIDRLPVSCIPMLRRSRRAALQDLGRSGVLAALGVSGIAGPQGHATAEGTAPPTSTASDLIYLSATEARDLFAAKRLSPVEVLEAQIAQIEARNAEVNCITYMHIDQARVAARESERRYAQGDPRPLAGITVGVKDDQQIAGEITTYGSMLFQDYRATENSPMVDKLKQAGAILSIQTTVPEMMFHAATWSYLWGVTHNPWNPPVHTGRIFWRVGRRIGRGFLHAGDGIGHGRLDSYPGRPLRSVRVQTAIRSGGARTG
jgi:hypothetical protein